MSKIKKPIPAKRRYRLKVIIYLIMWLTDIQDFE